MAADLDTDHSVDDRIPLWEFVVRVGVVTLALLLSYYCSQEGERFFYQGF